MSIPHYDTVVVGGGFGGIYQLHKLRSLGFKVKGFEKGTELGGVWHWNTYPGVRVDSDAQIYQLWLEECYKDWTFSERFPSGPELVEYFRHVDAKLDISKDYSFETVVSKAVFDVEAGHWTVYTTDTKAGTESHVDIQHPTCTAQHLIICSGFASKVYIPDFPGMSKFKGRLHHSAQWPRDGLDLRGKRVAVIGTGSSGVQIIQAVGPVAGQLTVFQRTPNIAIPMGQRPLDATKETLTKPYLPQMWADTLRFSSTGFPYRFDARSALAVPPAERDAFFADLFGRGGFNFWVGTFHDVWTNVEADALQYDFWRRQVLKRIKDPGMAAKLAPAQAMCTFCSKRPSLEQNYYEVFNQPNVRLVDVNSDPILEFTERGIRTKDQEMEFDVVVLATGFDAVTGGLTQIDIQGLNGIPLRNKWKQGVNTYLGMCTSWFPNMYFMYGPQGPTVFSNGPTCAQIQADWITDALIYCRRKNLKYMHAAPEAEMAWRQHVNQLQDLTLVKGSRYSWYVGSNVPGKPVEALMYLGGIPKYLEEVGVEADSSFKNFIKVAK